MLLQQLRDRLVTHAYAVPDEHLASEQVRALARPPQRRLRVAARRGVDQILQLRPRIRLLDLEGSPSATLATNLHQVIATRTSTSLVPSLSNRADRKARRTCHGGHATPPNRIGLGARPQPTRALVHRRLQQAPLLADESLNLHAKRRSCRRDPVDPLSCRFDRIVRPRALTARRLRLLGHRELHSTPEEEPDPHATHGHGTKHLASDHLKLLRLLVRSTRGALPPIGGRRSTACRGSASDRRPRWPAAARRAADVLHRRSRRNRCEASRARRVSRAAGASGRRRSSKAPIAPSASARVNGVARPVREGSRHTLLALVTIRFHKLATNAMFCKRMSGASFG